MLGINLFTLGTNQVADAVELNLHNISKILCGFCKTFLSCVHNLCMYVCMCIHIMQLYSFKLNFYVYADLESCVSIINVAWSSTNDHDDLGFYDNYTLHMIIN